MESLKLGKNDPCPCNSGKKYRQCCWLKRLGISTDHKPPPEPPPPSKTTVVYHPATFWTHPPGQPNAAPPQGAVELTDWCFVKDKGWTHERDLKPGDQVRQKGGSWETIPPERVIDTTQEHPFYVRGKGWTPARELKEGDLVRTVDGWVPVTKVVDTGRYETVYNLRVADYHTYFVGTPEWGFAVWAHNNNACVTPLTAANAVTEGEKALVAAGEATGKQYYKVAAPGKTPQYHTDLARMEGVAAQWNAEFEAAAKVAAAKAAERADIARTIAGGHAKTDHLFGRDGRFRRAGIDTEAKFQAHIDKAIEAGEAKALAGGKTAIYYKDAGGLETIVVLDLKTVDKGTAWVGTRAQFDGLK